MGSVFPVTDELGAAELKAKKKPAKVAKASPQPTEMAEIKISVPAHRLEQLKQYGILEGLRAKTALETEALEAAVAAYDRKIGAALDKDEELELRVMEAQDKKKGAAK